MDTQQKHRKKQKSYIEKLKDGKVNDLQRQGVMINEPDFILQITSPQDKRGSLYGVFGKVTKEHFDYLIHREHGITLNEKKDYYRSNPGLRITVRYQKGNSGDVLVTKTFSYSSPDGEWEKVNERKDDTSKF